MISGKRFFLSARTSAVICMEAFLLAGLLLGLAYQMKGEIDTLVRANRASAELIARVVSRYFSEIERVGAEYSPSELKRRLDSELGFRKLVADSRLAPQYSIHRIADEQRGPVKADILRAVEEGRSWTVSLRGDAIAVTQLFQLEGSPVDYGAVVVPMSRRAVYVDVIQRNLALYLSVGFLYLAQVLLAFLVLRSPRAGDDIVFEKGYLRERALGALKLQRQILDGIIDDHERFYRSDAGTPDPGEASRAADSEGKVLSISDAKRKKDS
ncbi:MAG: hypothetical protein KIT79_08085 [Deltaproteobacteria bacterium]|nr:hypothetical protein [Deltaproteobacteria bacterium]